MVAYAFVISLINYIIMTICGLFSFYFFGSILFWFYYRKISLGMNYSIRFYIFIEFIFGLCCIHLGIYFITFWRGDTNIYQPVFIFSTFAPMTVVAVMGPFATCFLGFERCLCLIFPLKKLGTQIFIVSVLTTIIAAGITIYYVVLIVLPLPAEANCRILSCLGSGKPNGVYLLLRQITGVTSVIIGAGLILLFKKQKKTVLFSNRITRLTVITLTCSILLDFTPHFVTFCLSNFWQINASDYIGSYSFVFSSINTFVCGFLYFKTMKKFVKPNTVTIS